MFSSATGTLVVFTLSSLMLIALGGLGAAIVAVVILPAYRRRIERFAAETVRRSLPLTEAEIMADRDRLRAEYAISISSLEAKVEQAELSKARQSIEINRREARIHELAQAASQQQLTVEELQNAKRVLEQAILDRLPKVEHRLAESRKLLADRDADVTLLSQTSAKQTQALEETTQINKQQSEELHRLRAALDTRAVRHRETLGDPRYDGEVALRTEIEMLRSRTRDQAKLIDRLQQAKTGSDEQKVLTSEIERLKRDLSIVEKELIAAKSSGSERDDLVKQLRALEQEKADRAVEIARLKAGLGTYENANSAASLPTKAATTVSLTARAELSALTAEIEEQRRTIQSLRADLASSNERLARQGQHFREELRRLGTGVLTSAEQRARDDAVARPPTLADRIISRPQRPELVSPPLLKAVIGGSDGATSDKLTDMTGESASVGPPPIPERRVASDVVPRRSRLLERISGLDKSS